MTSDACGKSCSARLASMRRLSRDGREIQCLLPGSTECQTRRPGSGSEPGWAHGQQRAPVRTTSAAPRKWIPPSGSGSRQTGETLQNQGHFYRSAPAVREPARRPQRRVLGAATHFMPEPLSSKSGLTRTTTRAGRDSSLEMAPSSSTSRGGFDIDQNAGSSGLPEFRLAFARPGKADFTRIGAGIERDLQFASRGNVDAIDQPGHIADHSRHFPIS